MTRLEHPAPRRRTLARVASAVASAILLALILAAVWPQYVWAAALWTGVGVLAVGAGGASAALVRLGLPHVAPRTCAAVATLTAGAVSWAVANACLTAVAAIQADAGAVVFAVVSALASYAVMRPRSRATRP